MRRWLGNAGTAVRGSRCCATALLLVVAGCGQVETDLAPGSTDASTGDGGPESGADGGGCRHWTPCQVVGEQCQNDCARPCQCIDNPETGRRELVCSKPKSGELCKSEGAYCYYPANLKCPPGQSCMAGGAWCSCTAPAGEPYWACGGESLCPSSSPDHGTSCATLPAGFSCRYDESTCECQGGGDGKVWACEQTN